MRFLFITGKVAITVRHWVERGPHDGSTESGSRVEVRRYEEDVPEPYNAAPPARLLKPFWRADLFTHDQGEEGNWERAHQHTEWKGNEPGPRSWSPEMSSDPVGYTMRRLENLPALLREAGAGAEAASIDPAELAALVPAIRTAIETCLKPAPASTAKTTSGKTTIGKTTRGRSAQ